MIHEELRPQLYALFYNPDRSTLSRRKNNRVQYDGFDMAEVKQADQIQVQTMSHGLNTLAKYTNPNEWTDNRTPAQRRHHEAQLAPFKPQSVKEAKEYYKTYGYQARRALWSTGELNRKQNTWVHVNLTLTDSTEQFLAYFAIKYKMRAIVLRPHPGRHQQVESTLEALACGMLALPINYKEILEDHHNHNKFRPGLINPNQRKHMRGNQLGTPWMFNPNYLTKVTPDNVDDQPPVQPSTLEQQIPEQTTPIVQTIELPPMPEYCTACHRRTELRWYKTRKGYYCKAHKQCYMYMQGRRTT